MCLSAGNAMQEQHQGQHRASGGLDIAKYDADRLQRVYHTYQTPEVDDTGGSGYAGPSSSSSSSIGRPTSARRTSRQVNCPGADGVVVGTGSIGVRPGSAAARRTKELLHNVGAAVPAEVAGNSLMPKSRVGASLLDALADRGSSSEVRSGSLSPVCASNQQAVPKARGLVKGSTDALWKTGKNGRGL